MEDFGHTCHIDCQTEYPEIASVLLHCNLKQTKFLGIYGIKYLRTNFNEIVESKKKKTPSIHHKNCRISFKTMELFIHTSWTLLTISSRG